MTRKVFLLLASVGALCAPGLARAGGPSFSKIDVDGVKLGMTLAQVRVALSDEALAVSRSSSPNQTATASKGNALEIGFFGSPNLDDPGRVVSIVKKGPKTRCDAIRSAFAEQGKPAVTGQRAVSASLVASWSVWLGDEQSPARAAALKCIQDHQALNTDCLGPEDVLIVRTFNDRSEADLCTYGVILHGGRTRAEIGEEVQSSKRKKGEERKATL